MDFGLGLILSFTDNATAGINNAVNSLNRLTQTAESVSGSLNDIASLSAFSVATNMMGSGLLKAGNSIFGMFSRLIGKVQATGSEFESFRLTLNALYKDEQKAEKAISKLLDFSVESPFEVGDVKDMLIVLQSQGIDAFADITGSITNTRKETLSWISDLMAFKPDEATSRWKRALTNYIGSAQPLMLRNILDMGSIPEILGHEMGKTVEERMNDIVEIVEKKGLTDLARNLTNTWTGVASNIEDAYTKLYKSIADNGVFDSLKSSFMSLSGAILSLSNEQIDALGKTIAGALNIIVKPLTYFSGVLNNLITALVELSQVAPGLVQTLLVSSAVFGILLVVAGVVLKFASALGMLTLGLASFKTTFSPVIKLMKSGLTMIKGKLKNFIPNLALFYLAWKTNFLGVRTIVTDFAKNTMTSLKTANRAVNGSVSDMLSALRNIKRSDSFFGNLTLGFMKVKMLMKALSDAWGDYTLSEENFIKAKELGILPLIEAILDLKYRFGYFKEGFIAGWNQINDVVIGIYEGFVSKAKGIPIFDVMINALTKFFEALSSGDKEAWYKLGESFAQIVAVAGGVILAFKVISGIIAVFTKVWGIVTAVVGAISAIVGAIGALPFAIIVALGVAIAFIIRFKDEIAQFFVNIWNSIKETFSNIGNWFSEKFTLAVEAIKNAFSTIGDFFKGVWDKIKEIFSNVGHTIASAISDTVSRAVNAVLSKAVSLINGFITAINNAINLINLIPGVNLSKIKKLQVPKMATGGVVDKPTMSIIGEAGAEAVVPLENNLGWISRLANELASEMRPTNSYGRVSSNSSGGQEYMTNNSNTSTTYHGNTDNSVVFNEGAIQVTVQNASDEEARKFAKKILEYIKRQKQLDKMVRYA